MILASLLAGTSFGSMVPEFLFLVVLWVPTACAFANVVIVLFPARIAKILSKILPMIVLVLLGINVVYTFNRDSGMKQSMYEPLEYGEFRRQAEEGSIVIDHDPLTPDPKTEKWLWRLGLVVYTPDGGLSFEMYKLGMRAFATTPAGKQAIFGDSSPSFLEQGGRKEFFRNAALLEFLRGEPSVMPAPSAVRQLAQLAAPEVVRPARSVQQSALQAPWPSSARVGEQERLTVVRQQDVGRRAFQESLRQDPPGSERTASPESMLSVSEQTGTDSPCFLSLKAKRDQYAITEDGSFRLTSEVDNYPRPKTLYRFPVECDLLLDRSRMRAELVRMIFEEKVAPTYHLYSLSLAAWVAVLVVLEAIVESGLRSEVNNFE